MALEFRHVLPCRDNRVLAAFHGILLRRQTECVPTHRMQHIEATHPFVAGDDIGCGVTFRVAYVQPCPTWVGKHVQNVKFRLRRIETFLARVRRMEKLPLFPNGLPFWFELIEGI